MSVSDITEEVHLILIREQGGRNAVHGRVAPALKFIFQLLDLNYMW